MAMRGFLQAGASAVLLVSACGGSGQPDASTASGAPTEAAGGGSAAATGAGDDCGPCVRAGGVYCTLPRGCLAVTDACEGLLLRDERACGTLATEIPTKQPDKPTLDDLMQPYGKPISAALSNFPGVQLKLEEGHCYVLRYAVGPGGEAGSVYPMTRVRSPEGTRTDQVAGALQQKPKGETKPICMRKSGTVDFFFAGSSEYDVRKELGEGRLTVWLLQGPLDLRAQLIARPVAVWPSPAPKPEPPPAPVATGGCTPCAPAPPAYQPPAREHDPRCGYKCRRDASSCRFSCKSRQCKRHCEAYEELCLRTCW